MTELMKDLPRKETVHNYLYGSDTSPPITQPPAPVSDNITSGEGGDTSQVSPDVKIKSEGDSIDKELEESLNSLYKEEIKMFASRKNMLRQNQIKLWGVVWGQCSPALQTEVKGDDGFVTALGKYNIVWLLTRLKLTAAGIDRSVSPYMALVNSITFFHTLRQQRDESIENYRRRFESAWNSATMNKASLGQHPDFNTYVADQDSSVTSTKDIEEKLCATYFITFADPGRFGGLWENLSNSTLLGRDDYPANITAAYDLLCHYRGGKRQNTHDTPVNVSFAQIRQAGDNLPPVPGSNGELIPDMTCWKCLRLGHLSRHCPERVKIGGVQHVQ